MKPAPALDPQRVLERCERADKAVAALALLLAGGPNLATILAVIDDARTLAHRELERLARRTPS